jgi:hypothetical protein
MSTRRAWIRIRTSRRTSCRKQIERHIDKLSSENFGPAMTFGGSLQDTTAVPGANGSGPNGNSANGSDGNGGDATFLTPQSGQNGNASSPSIDLIA